MNSEQTAVEPLRDVPTGFERWAIVIAAVSLEISRQAEMIAYVNAYLAVAAVAALATPLVLLIKRPPR